MRIQKTVFERYERLKKEGRGQGIGSSYKPWTTVRDVQSLGKSNRLKGWKSNRIHHFLSDLELHYFYTLEWSLSITDIREKFPLPPNKTLDLADRLEIKHPNNIKLKQPRIMTTDFLLDVRIDEYTTKLFARNVMPKNKLNKKREIEKLEIERMYWAERGIDWGIVTEDEIPKSLVQNISWIHGAYLLKNSPNVTLDLLGNVESHLFEELRNSQSPFPKSAAYIDNYFGLKAGTCFWIIRHLIANRIWVKDMNVEVDLSKALQLEKNIFQK